MDALPLAINQQQLKFMHDEIGQAIVALRNKNQSGEFASNDDQMQEQNLLTYGTNDYEVARSLVEEIDAQLKSHLEEWDGDAAAAKPVAIALNSFQIGVLRSSIQQAMQHLNDQEAKRLHADILEQLPENSPQEDAD